jgi:hypothetical protein
MSKPHTRTITLPDGRTIVEHQPILPIAGVAEPIAPRPTLPDPYYRPPHPNWREMHNPQQPWTCYSCHTWHSGGSGWTAYYNASHDKWICAECYTRNMQLFPPVVTTAPAPAAGTDTTTPPPAANSDLLAKIAFDFQHLSNRHKRLILFQTELAAKGICTGKRGYKSLAKGDALYAIHGMGQSCPMHGQPDRGTRIRKYVGISTGPEAVEVMAAMERATQYAHLLDQIKQLTNIIGMTEHHIKTTAELLAAALTEIDAT